MRDVLDTLRAKGVEIPDGLSMEDESIKVIVLKGAGGQAFVSGADISEFDQKRNSAEAKAAYAQIAGQASRYLHQSDKPVIALIEGYCIGGGLATAAWRSHLQCGGSATSKSHHGWTLRSSL